MQQRNLDDHQEQTVWALLAAFSASALALTFLYWLRRRRRKP